MRALVGVIMTGHVEGWFLARNISLAMNDFFAVLKSGYSTHAEPVAGCHFLMISVALDQDY